MHPNASAISVFLLSAQKTHPCYSLGLSTWRRRLSFYYAIFRFFFRIHYFFVDEFWNRELQQLQTRTVPVISNNKILWWNSAPHRPTLRCPHKSWQLFSCKTSLSSIIPSSTASSSWSWSETNRATLEHIHCFTLLYLETEQYNFVCYKKNDAEPSCFLGGNLTFQWNNVIHPDNDST